MEATTHPRAAWLAQWREQVLSALALLYLVGIGMAMLLVPLSTLRWMRLPFLGAFVEPTLLLSNAGPVRGEGWALHDQGFGLDYRLVALDDHPVTTPGDVATYLAQRFPGEEVTLTLRRVDGTTQRVTLTLQPFPGADRWAYFYLPYLMGVIYLISAIWVFLVRRYSRNARLFAWFAASAAFSLAGILDAFAIHRWDGLWSFTLPLSGAALFGLALHFPSPLGWVRRRPWAHYLPVAVAVVFGLYANWTLRLAPDPYAYIYAWRWCYLLTGTGALAFLGTMLWRRSQAPSPLEREQAGLVVITTLVSFGPLGFWLIAPVFGLTLPFQPWMVVLTGFFPIGVGYTVLRYRVLRVDYLLQQGVLYALAGTLIALAYGLLVSGSTLLFGAALSIRSPAGVGFLLVVLALALEPLRRLLQQGVNALFAHQESRYQQRLEQFGEALTLLADETEVRELLYRYVQEDLAPEPFHLFLYDPVLGVYRATPDLSGEPSSDLRFTPESPFLAWLSRQGHATYLEGVEDWPSEVRAEIGRVLLLHAVLFVPLPGRQQGLVGFMALGPRRNRRPYLSRDVDYLENLARQTALALERAQVVGVLERRVSELNTLARVAQGVNIAPTFDDLLELIYAQTTRLIPATLMHITLWDPRYDALSHVFYVRHEERLHEREGRPLPENQGLTYRVFQSGQVLRVDDYERACRVQGGVPEEEGVFAWMGVPLVVGADRIGVLALGHHTPTVTYSHEQQGILQAIADQAAGAIVKARLLRESERRARQLALLNEVARTLTATLDLEPLLRRLLESAMELLECEAATLFLVDEETGELVFHSALGPVGSSLVGRRLPPGTGLVGEAVSQQRTVLVPDVQRDPRWSDALDQETGFHTRSVLVAPLVAQEQALGAIEVLNKRDGSRFTEEDEQILLALASQAAVALQNARLYAQTDQALAARVEELSVLQRIDRELSTSLDVARTMRITLEWAVRRTASHGGFIGQVDEETQTLHIIADQGMRQSLMPYLRSGLPLEEFPLLQKAVQAGQTQYWQSGAQDSGRPLLADTQAQIVLPLRHEAGVVGLLVLETASSQGYDEETQRFLTRLVDHASVAVANARLYSALQQANRAKSEFISFVAHELKTPMTSIRGYTDLLLAEAVGPINDTQRNFLRTIRDNVERMAALVTDLADISRIEAQQLRLDFQQVDMRDVIDEVVRSLQQQIEVKEQRLTLEVPEHLPPVWGDRMRLVQVLTNLVSNAHKYTPSGGSITIRAEHTPNVWDEEGPPEVVHIAVADTGLGIHPDEQPRIFQRFFRSEADKEAREAPGTGLGLYITKTLVEMQGGRIWFESEYRKGTTFHFTVPVATAMEQEAPAADEE